MLLQLGDFPYPAKVFSAPQSVLGAVCTVHYNAVHREYTSVLTVVSGENPPLSTQNRGNVPNSGRKPPELSVFRGGVQTAEHTTKATKEVPVAVATRHCAQVVTQNDKGTEAEQNEHQDGHPWRAHVVALRGGRRIARAGIGCIHTVHTLRVGMVEMMCLVQATRLSALRSYTTTGFAFWRSHEKRV